MHPFLHSLYVSPLIIFPPQDCAVNGLISCISFTVFLHLAVYCWSDADRSDRYVTRAACSRSFNLTINSLTFTKQQKSKSFTEVLTSMISFFFPPSLPSSLLLFLSTSRGGPVPQVRRGQPDMMLLLPLHSHSLLPGHQWHGKGVL